MEAQSYRCALSGRELLPTNAAPDHKQPRSQGGSDDLSNLQIVIDVVNRAKQDMTNEEFVQLCRDVVRWADAKGVPAMGPSS